MQSGPISVKRRPSYNKCEWAQLLFCHSFKVNHVPQSIFLAVVCHRSTVLQRLSLWFTPTQLAPPPDVFTLNICCMVRAVNHTECEMPFRSCPSRARFCLGDSPTCRTSLLDAIVINDTVMERSAKNHVRPLSRYKSSNKSSDMGKSDSNVVTRGCGDLSVLFQHCAYIPFFTQCSQDNDEESLQKHPFGIFSTFLETNQLLTLFTLYSLSKSLI